MPTPHSQVRIYVSSTFAWSAPARFAQDFATLPDGERQRVLRLLRPEQRRATLVGRLLLRQALLNVGAAASDLASLTYTRSGKPYLPGTKLGFSISHAGDHVICAVAPEGRVGVDLEPVRPLALDDFEDTMDPDQWRAILAAEDPSCRFLGFWTMKESLAKCQGGGLGLPLREIRGDAPSLSFRGEPFHVTAVDAVPGYVCHLASKQRSVPVVVAS